jgi:hypothetical protein
VTPSWTGGSDARDRELRALDERAVIADQEALV